MWDAVEGEAVILRCNYEEVRALRAGAQAVLEPEAGSQCGALASREARAGVAALRERLEGDLSFQTLAELRSVEAALSTIVECLRVEMDALVIATHPAHEGAVAAYFDFAHTLAVLGRVQEMGREMEAVVELVTGAPATAASAREFVFPD